MRGNVIGITAQPDFVYLSIVLCFAFSPQPMSSALCFPIVNHTRKPEFHMQSRTVSRGEFLQSSTQACWYLAPKSEFMVLLTWFEPLPRRTTTKHQNPKIIYWINSSSSWVQLAEDYFYNLQQENPKDLEWRRRTIDLDSRKWNEESFTGSKCWKCRFFSLWSILLGEGKEG